MEGEHYGVYFLILMIVTSGMFRLIVTERHSLQNVTKMQNSDVVIECRSESISATSQPYWIRYNPQSTTIYDPTSSTNINSKKYSIANRNNALTVKTVQLGDAATYCCSFDPWNDYCANLVVIGSMTASVNPNGVKPGVAVNLSCSLSYNSPMNDASASFPLSDDQDLHLAMFIRTNKTDNGINGKEVVNTATVPHQKTLSVNRTMKISDDGRRLVCKLSSRNPQTEIEVTNPVIVYERRSEEMVDRGGGSPLLPALLPVLLFAGFAVFFFTFVKVYRHRKASSSHRQTPTTSTSPVFNTWSSSQVGADPQWIQMAPPPYTTAVESNSKPYENEDAPPLYNSLFATEPNAHQAIVRTPDMTTDGHESTATAKLA